MTLRALSVVLHETIRRNRVDWGILYLQISRGVARRDHAFPAADTPPAIVVTAKNLDPSRNEAIARDGMAVVTVPDTRLETLAKIVKTSKIVPTAMEFVDIAGLVRGASKGEGLGNKFLQHIR